MRRVQYRLTPGQRLAPERLRLQVLRARVPSAFIGESEPDRRFLMRRFAPKRPFGTGSGSTGGGGETAGAELLLGSSLSERFSLAAAGSQVLRLGHEGARKVNMVVTRALSGGNFTGYLSPCFVVC